MNLLLLALPLLSSTSNLPAPGALLSADVEAAIEVATRRLVELQENMSEADGPPREWPYEGVYRERGQIPPGYRVGGTSIAAWALLEAPGFAKDEGRREAVERGLGFVLEQLETDPRLGPGFNGSYDVRGWGHAYALEFLLRLRGKGAVPEGQDERVGECIDSLVELLEEAAIGRSGGWNYARRGGLENDRAGASPFMTAPTLLALERARGAGVEVDEDILLRGYDALLGGISGEEVLTYNTSRGGGDTQAGSIGRLPATYLALSLREEAGPEELERAVEHFFTHWEELEKRRRKNGTHVAPHGIAPYYFFYAHLYAAMAIEELPAPRRKEYRARFLDRLFEVREESGGWNDRVFERSENFGTATSLLALLAPELQRLP